MEPYYIRAKSKSNGTCALLGLEKYLPIVVGVPEQITLVAGDVLLLLPLAPQDGE